MSWSNSIQSHKQRTAPLTSSHAEPYPAQIVGTKTSDNSVTNARPTFYQIHKKGFTKDDLQGLKNKFATFLAAKEEEYKLSTDEGVRAVSDWTGGSKWNRMVLADINDHMSLRTQYAAQASGGSAG